MKLLANMRAIGLLKRRPRLSKGATFAAVAIVALVVTGCTKGTYQVDIFPEMHYQQSYRGQEPPRIMPNPDAVPITGKEVQFASAQAAQVAPNPLPASREVLERGSEVYRINCSMCHGVTAQGEGPVGDVLVRNNYLRPPNLMAHATQSKTDGDIFYIVTNGIFVMPEFKNLLSEDDRWSVVHYLRFLAQQ